MRACSALSGGTSQGRALPRTSVAFPCSEQADWQGKGRSCETLSDIIQPYHPVFCTSYLHLALTFSAQYDAAPQEMYNDGVQLLLSHRSAIKTSETFKHQCPRGHSNRLA